MITTEGEGGRCLGNGYSIKYVAALASVALAGIGGIVWTVENIGSVRKDIEQLSSNVQNLNTPLSQRVFSVEARTNEIARIQSEVRSRVEAIDSSGTTQNKILKRDVDSMRAEIAGNNIRCHEAVRKIDEISGFTIENRLRIQHVIEAINPHEAPRKRK